MRLKKFATECTTMKLILLQVKVLKKQVFWRFCNNNNKHFYSRDYYYYMIYNNSIIITYNITTYFYLCVFWPKFCDFVLLPVFSGV